MALADMFSGLMSSGHTPEVADYFKDLEAPDVKQMELRLQQLVEQGAITPEKAATVMQQASDMNGISLDPNLKKNQMAALQGLQDISDSGGMTAADEANLQKIQNQENSAARGKREAIIQNAQARGLGGSGLELMSQMQNAQDSATRASQRDMDVAGQAQQRALEALMQQGQMSGQMQNQEFNQKAQVAGANDAISRFNAQNQQAQINNNVNARNAAQATNLQNKQSIADTNVGIRNDQQKLNKGLRQTDFDNEMRKRQAQAQIAMQNANAAGRDSQAAAAGNNQMMGTALSAAAMFSDERGKCDISEVDPGDFLDSITGYKYKYKDKKHGEGEHVGVMAQDLEKTDAGSKLVVDTPEGKVVDYGKAGPHIMSSLANLNKRLKELEGEEEA